MKRRQTISWIGRWPQFDASQGLLKPQQAAGEDLLEKAHAGAKASPLLAGELRALL